MENDNKGQDGPVPERYMAALRLEPGTPFVPASNGPIAEMVPMTLVLLPEGTKDNKPSFVIILKHPANPLMVLGFGRYQTERCLVFVGNVS